MQYSEECAGPQKHNDESPVFIHCMVLEMQLFYLIPFSEASCFLEASHLVQNNRCILRTKRVFSIRLSIQSLLVPLTICQLSLEQLICLLTE